MQQIFHKSQTEYDAAFQCLSRVKSECVATQSRSIINITDKVIIIANRKSVHSLDEVHACKD